MPIRVPHPGKLSGIRSFLLNRCIRGPCEIQQHEALTYFV